MYKDAHQSITYNNLKMRTYTKETLQIYRMEYYITIKIYGYEYTLIF